MQRPFVRVFVCLLVCLFSGKEFSHLSRFFSVLLNRCYNISESIHKIKTENKIYYESKLNSCLNSICYPISRKSYKRIVNYFPRHFHAYKDSHYKFLCFKSAVFFLSLSLPHSHTHKIVAIKVHFLRNASFFFIDKNFESFTRLKKGLHFLVKSFELLLLNGAMKRFCFQHVERCFVFMCFLTLTISKFKITLKTERKEFSHSNRTCYYFFSFNLSRFNFLFLSILESHTLLLFMRGK